MNTSKGSSLGEFNYWDRLSSLKLFSLQRRRERYMIIHVWKIIHNHAPNDLGMEFPPFNKQAPNSARTLYDSSFAIRAGMLWNRLPQNENLCDQLDSFKILLGRFLLHFPDQPPSSSILVTDYTTRNNNSIIDWTSQSGGLQLAQRPS